MPRTGQKYIGSALGCETLTHRRVHPGAAECRPLAFGAQIPLGTMKTINDSMSQGSPELFKMKSPSTGLVEPMAPAHCAGVGCPASFPDSSDSSRDWCLGLVLPMIRVVTLGSPTRWSAHSV